MKDSFLESIVSSALEAQNVQSSTDSETQKFSAITERDGYVGEMVKASLALFEAKEADFTKKFPSDYMIITDTLSVKIGGSAVATDIEPQSMASIQDIFDWVLESADLSKSEVKNISTYYGSDKKVHFEFDSDYGKGDAIVGLDAYQEVDVNTVLTLPVK